MKKYLVASLTVIAVIVYARLSFYTVDAAEYAYVTVLGQHVATYDGADPVNGAGLKFGLPWPIQQVQRLDRRLQQFDLRETEQLTHEGNTIDKMLLIEAYVCWKISPDQGVDRFVKSIGTAKRAREILEPQINGNLGAAIGQMRMDELVNSEAINPATGKSRVDVAVELLRKGLLAALQPRMHDEYGIELVDIRLRRFNHPANVRESIFSRIRAERSMEATKHLSEGDRQAADIINKTEAEVRKTLAEAKAKEEKIKADADIAAMKIRNEAYAQDPEFYRFVKTMDELQSIVGGPKTMLLLSTHHPMFERMFKEPRPKEKDKKAEKQ